MTQRQFVNAYQRGEVDSDELATALRRYDELDADGEQFADEVIAQTGDDGPDLLLADVCNSPCEAVIRDVYQFYKQTELSKSKAKDLLNGYGKYTESVNVENTEFSSLDEIQNRLRRLDRENINGLFETIRERGNDNVNNIKGLDGETKIVEDQLDGDVNSDRITMEDDLGESELPDTTTKESTTETLENEFDYNIKDVDESDSDIDVNIDNAPAYESKTNIGPGSVPEGIPGRSSSVADEINELRKKIQTMAVAGEDEIIVVTRTDTEADFNQATKRELSNDYGVEYDNFEDMSNKLEEDIELSLEEMRSSDKIEGDLPEDVEITFKSYEEVTPKNG